MEGGFFTVHINSGRVIVQKNTARPRLRKEEIGKRSVVPKDPIVFDIQNCTKLIDNQLHQFCVWIAGMEFSSNEGGYTFLGTEEGMENIQTILKQVIIEISESGGHDL